VKICPFNQVGYDRIEEQYQRMREIEAEREGGTGGVDDGGDAGTAAGASD
jgi:hypothetical protein